jgi:glycosyltransferase involved in cell wall biosynthesis
MRIGFDVTPLCVPQSGVGTYTSNLLDHLEQCADDQILPLTHRPWHIDASRSPNGHVPFFRLNKTVWMQTVLPRQLARLGLDVCHFTNAVAPLWTPCPSVVTIHDMTLWLFPELHGRRRLLAMRPVIPLAARRAAAIITVSHSAKRDIVSILGVPEHKVHVVYEAPAPFFRVLERDPKLEAIREHHELPERFVLHVGTIEPRKNLVRLLEAFAQFRRDTGESHTLILVGQRGWRDEAVFSAAERLALGNAVRFLGYVSPDTLVALYNLADAVAFPSLYEGFGLPVVEAIVCGTPVVASANGSLAEIAGDAAEFVNPMDVESIAAGLQRVLVDRTRHVELRTKGLARASLFSWGQAAIQTRQIYTAAVQDR